MKSSESLPGSTQNGRKKTQSSPRVQNSGAYSPDGSPDSRYAGGQVIMIYNRLADALAGAVVGLSVDCCWVVLLSRPKAQMKSGLALEKTCTLVGIVLPLVIRLSGPHIEAHESKQ